MGLRIRGCSQESVFSSKEKCKHFYNLAPYDRYKWSDMGPTPINGFSNKWVSLFCFSLLQVEGTSHHLSCRRESQHFEAEGRFPLMSRPTKKCQHHLTCLCLLGDLLLTTIMKYNESPSWQYVNDFLSNRLLSK